MKLPTGVMDIRVSITPDRDMIVDVIPHPLTRCKPQCAYIEIGDIPSDISAYIDQDERKARKAQ